MECCVGNRQIKRVKMGNLIKIDEKNIPEQYEGYEKKIGLSTISDLYVMIGECDNTVLKNKKECLFVRIDAMREERFNLPRGKDVNYQQLNEYLNWARKFCPNAILLIAEHPSIQSVGEYIPREETNGGVSILIEFGFRVVIEYVGHGFDVGEITRSKCVHNSMIIPWEILLERPSKIYYMVKKMGLYYSISSDGYTKSRNERIKNLCDLCPQIVNNIQDCIPYEASHLTLTLFENIFNDCITNIIWNLCFHDKKRVQVVGNIYKNVICYFEIIVD